ncbi:hypothetical protein LC613_33000 [Nostoc sphaeroides CHAB 2801]|uniref:WD40 repeat domain-containing protein n=1 Tax=Nostoc sphaeroides TaxID=446679 RepID=UPI001E3AF23C|nr:hypothetical protein [Nostoc sphaeroides]MCC5632444.1 hypothetical protein [Nostoc sphaeroides CHAB 2801]
MLERLNGKSQHTSSVNSISFSPDSKIIASASKDGTVKLWNLEGRELKTFKANSSQKYLADKNNIGVASVTFSPNGKTLAYGDSETGKITLLNFDINDLLKKSCNNLHDYLKNNPIRALVQETNIYVTIY